MQYECGHHGRTLSHHVKCHGDFIIVGDHMKSIYLIVYNNHGEWGVVLEERTRDNSENRMRIVEILGEDVYLGA